MKDNKEIKETKEVEKTKNSEAHKIETGYGKIFATAVLTALLTSITQYYLQNSKLSGDQEYWKKRYTIENIDKINSQRLQIVDDVTKELLLLEVKAKEIKIKAAGSKYFTTTEEINELTNLMIQYHKDSYLCVAKLQMVSLYFGSEVDSIIPILGKALQLNFQNNLLIKQSGVKVPEFELDFETIDTLTNSRTFLTRAMIDEIMNSYKFKNE